MSSLPYDERQPAGGFIGLRRTLIAAVVVALLSALSVLGTGGSSGDPASLETSDARSFRTPVYDGRGKWSGY